MNELMKLSFKILESKCFGYTNVQTQTLEKEWELSTVKIIRSSPQYWQVLKWTTVKHSLKNVPYP